MIQFIETYAPWIISVVVILGPQIPALISRSVSDKNLLNVFSNVKEVAKDISFKETDISKAIASINQITSVLKDEIDKMEMKVGTEIQRINETVLAFQEGEIYQKMLNGLSQLDELAELLKNKDTTIEQLGQVIKDIKKKLG
jgi:hypothetical protein